jgi:aminoglycoside/choline kinase family phosphotransferase
VKPEVSERLLITELYENSKNRVEELSNTSVNDVVKLTGDASTRRYYRISTDNNSYVSCLAELKESVESSDFLNVQSVLDKNGIRVPRIIDQNIKKGYMLQEDLGNVTFLSHISNEVSPGRILNEYIKVLDSLIEIHKIKRDKSFNWGKLEFDNEKFLFEMNFTKKYFMNLFLDKELSKEEEKIYDSQVLSLVSELTKKEMVLSHRDFHSRNIMVKNDEFIYIDFQDARQGIPQYDLVSLLEDCYFQLDEENVNKLKKYYFQNFISEFSRDQKTFEEFERMYDLMTVQRVLKAIGSFAYIYETRKDVRYVKYIGYAFEKVRNKLKAFPEYRDLYNLLVKSYYES